MTLYAYAGRDLAGQELQGVHEAEDERALRDVLRRRGVLLVQARVAQAARAKPLRVRQDQLARMTLQLASMLEAGLPLGRCLQIFEREAETDAMRRLVRSIAADVEEGSPLSASLAKHPQIFSEFYIGLVTAGERSGTLAHVLGRVARQLEAAQELKRKVVGALTYPAIVSIMGVLVSTLLVTRVVPVFEEVYGQLGTSLPLPTRLLVGLSRAARSYGLLLVAAAPILVWQARRYLRTPAGRELADRIRLGFPLVGRLMRMVVVTRFISTLAILLGSGVATLEALAVAERVAASFALSAVVSRIREYVRRGASISSALAASPLFPRQVASLVAVGEETGSLPAMLDRAAKQLDSEIDYLIKKTLVKLEPLVTTILAVWVGFIVLGLYLPMFDLLGKVGH
jgi:type IV pilus assembly protein PilC